MDTIEVRGGRSLFGSVEIPGAKNSALPLIAASILCYGAVTLTNVPCLSDVNAALQILSELGCKARIVDKTVDIDAHSLQKSAVPEHLMCAMRSSLFFLAPLLTRMGRAEISTPGGCRLGARPIDIHLAGLSAMGAEIVQTENGKTIVSAPAAGLRGTDYTLRFPSVGATETLLMASVSAVGRTVLRGVAKEPEITDLIRFLQSAGAHIAGAQTNVLYIEGGDLLAGTTHSVCPDRITAATVLCAVAACGGEVLLMHCSRQQLKALLPLLQTLGCVFSATGDTSLCVASNGPKCAIGNVFTDIYPGLSTDVSPLLMAAVLRAEGKSRCADTIFEHRFACSDGFRALGGMAKIEGNALEIHGVPALYGTALHAQELRGGAALVLAALQAQGQSTIDGVAHIARGYEDIAQMFRSLGADISLRQAAAHSA
ncbi:MAG: UDP-N-acetylglucosamine 1-carboxyvinyltransferase [Ruthenibacterium sp.]